MRAIVAYMMAPISPSNGRTVAQNIATAKAWMNFLRVFTRDLRFDGMPITIIAPYIAAIVSGADENSEADREHGLRDDCAIVERCDLVIAVGYTPTRQLTRGMQMEREACAGPLVDLMDIGRRLDQRVDLISDEDKATIVERIHEALSQRVPARRDVAAT